MISKRLGAIASMVRRGSKVADVGTDHGLLPIYLIEQDISPFVIATDIGASPAAVARKNVKAAKLESYIDVRVGDGLAPVSPDHADDIVIAGMGGETIAEILSAAPWVKDPHYRLILQPMTHAEAVHAWLLENGFSIREERFLEDAGRGYVLLYAEYTNASENTDPLTVWCGALSTEEGRPYFLKCAKHLEKCAAGCAARGSEQEAEELRILAKKLQGL